MPLPSLSNHSGCCLATSLLRSTTKGAIHRPGVKPAAEIEAARPSMPEGNLPLGSQSPQDLDHPSSI